MLSRIVIVIAGVLTLCICTAVYSQVNSKADTSAKLTADLVALEGEYGNEDIKLLPPLNGLAEHYGQQGAYRKALGYAQRSLDITEKKFGPENPKVARCLHEVGGLYKDLGEYSKALPLFQRSLAIREKSFGNDDLEVAWSLNHIADVYRIVGDYARALPLFERSLAIREKVLGVQHPQVAASLSNLGTLFHNIGEYEKALTYFLRSIAIFDTTLGQSSYKTLVLNDLGALYRDMGEYGKALQVHEQSLAIQEALFGPLHPSVARNLNNLGALYQDLGEYSKALPLHQRSLEILSNALGAKHEDVAIVLNNLGQLYQRQGEYEKAISMYERSLTTFRSVLGPDHPYVARELGNLAGLYQEAGQIDKALSLLEESRSIYGKTLNPEHPWIGMNLSSIASIDFALGEYARALPRYQEALRIGNQANRPELIWRAQDGLRNVLRKMKQPEVAIFFGKQAVNTIQELRGRLTGVDRELQKSFLSDKTGAYRGLAELMIEQGRLPEAQQVLAMLKEEEFFDFIRRDAKNDPRTTQTSLTAQEEAWGKRYQQLSGQLAALGVEHEELLKKARLGLSSAEQTRRKQVEIDLRIARLSFDQFLGALMREVEAAGSARALEVGERGLRSLQALQGTLGSLGPGVVALHYLMGEEKLRILLTTPSVQIARESNIGAKVLNAKVAQFRRVLQNPKSNPLPIAQELYRFMIEPVAEDLKQANAKTLMVSLDGALRYIPLAALHDGKTYVVEQYRVAIFTEAAKDKLKDAPQENWSLEALGLTHQVEGFSALPGVRRELEGIVLNGNQGILPGEAHFDSEFTANQMRSALDMGYSVLHVASHFVFQPGTESNSFLLLGDGHRLTLREIKENGYDFRNVDLVTLSACETAVGGGRDANGQEIEGFGALAQKQGAKGVIATLWTVADESTGQLMQSFYRLRESEKLTKAEALRQAQLRFVQGGFTKSTYTKWETQLTDFGEVSAATLYTHPYFWAPFILLGNWL